MFKYTFIEQSFLSLHLTTTSYIIIVVIVILVVTIIIVMIMIIVKVITKLTVQEFKAYWP